MDIMLCVQANSRHCDTDTQDKWCKTDVLRVFLVVENMT